jgi:hypothetical protein
MQGFPRHHLIQLFDILEGEFSGQQVLPNREMIEVHSHGKQGFIQGFTFSHVTSGQTPKGQYFIFYEQQLQITLMVPENGTINRYVGPKFHVAGIEKLPEFVQGFHDGTKIKQLFIKY